MSEQTNITAELRNWVLVLVSGGKEGYYWGDVYNDINERWPDGTRIHTSLIKHIDLTNPDYYLVHTLNSIYKLPRNSSSP